MIVIANCKLSMICHLIVPVIANKFLFSLSSDATVEIMKHLVLKIAVFLHCNLFPFPMPVGGRILRKILQLLGVMLCKQFTSSRIYVCGIATPHQTATLRYRALYAPTACAACVLCLLRYSTGYARHSSLLQSRLTQYGYYNTVILLLYLIKDF